MEFEKIIGTSVIYKDYLDQQRFGKIIWAENYNGPEPDDDNLKIVWVYIEDEDPVYNDKELVIDVGSYGNPDIRNIKYAELRLSNEVMIDL